MKYSVENQEWGQFTVGLLASVFQLICMVLAGWSQVLLVSISFIPGFIIYWQNCKEQNHKMSGAEKTIIVLVLLLSVLAIYFVTNGTIAIS